MAFKPDSKHYYGENRYLNYREVGEGDKTVILLHGFAASGRTWDDILPLLEQEKYRFIIFDLIGFGFSSKHSGTDHSMPANADAIIKFIQEKDLKDYVIAGHSFGGGVTILANLKLAELPENKPAGMILVDAAVYKTELPFFVKHLQTPVLANIMQSMTSAEYQARYTLEKIYYDKAKVTDEKVARYAFFMNIPEHKKTMRQTARQIVPADFEQYTAKYSQLQLPTLIVWGQQDSALPVSSGKKLAAELPNAQSRIIENCGHNPQEEKPEETAQVISEFLAKLND